MFFFSFLNSHKQNVFLKWLCHSWQSWLVAGQKRALMWTPRERESEREILPLHTNTVLCTTSSRHYAHTAKWDIRRAQIGMLQNQQGWFLWQFLRLVILQAIQEAFLRQWLRGAILFSFRDHFILGSKCRCKRDYWNELFVIAAIHRFFYRAALTDGLKNTVLLFAVSGAPLRRFAGVTAPWRKNLKLHKVFARRQPQMATGDTVWM